MGNGTEKALAPRSRGVAHIDRLIHRPWQGWREEGPFLSCWTAIILLGLFTRYQVLLDFAYVFIDLDQVLLWSAADEALKGRIHEPRFYGQAYNTMVEGLLGAPLVAGGFPYHIALPSVTSVLAFAPFVLLSLVSAHAGNRLSAFVIAALPVLLPLRYEMITSIPRGFVPGVFLAALACCLDLAKRTRARTFVFGLLLVLAVSANPNASIVALPVGLQYWIRRWKSAELYVWGGIGLLMGVVIHWLSVGFYYVNPAHLVYTTSPDAMQFRIAALVEGMANVSRHFGDLVPVASGNVAVLAIVFALLLFALYRIGDRASFVALLVGVLFALASLGFKRTHFGDESVFWPLSRMYLGLPILLAMGLVWLEHGARTRLSWRPPAWPLLVLAGLVVSVAAWKTANVGPVVEANLELTNRASVMPLRVDRVEESCADLVSLASKTGSELVVFVNSLEVLAYGCEAVAGGRLRTLLVQHWVSERRTWRILEEVRRQPRNLLVHGVSAGELERARALGIKKDPPVALGLASFTPIRIPDGVDIFRVFTAMGLDGGERLATRARLLTGAAARGTSDPLDVRE